MRRRALTSDRDLFGDLDAVGVLAGDLAGVVLKHSYCVQSQIRENLRAQAALMLRLLLAVRGTVRSVVAKSGSGLMQVDQNAPPFLGDPLHGAANQQVAFAIR